ncbi:hypothetical protein pipiens_011917 [Culex pipiens pipiens]|uniref:Uncharacterized protein n=1 Tax=Culex pipiens pipiens TaxID=38569 RepID=A0ABD1D5U2_CULPP
MRSVLITFTGLMGLAWASPTPVLVLVANGSDITINLSGDTSNNRLVSVVSDAGNNNPSVFDWVGGNGANKARGWPSVEEENPEEVVPTIMAPEVQR